MCNRKRKASDAVDLARDPKAARSVLGYIAKSSGISTEPASGTELAVRLEEINVQIGIFKQLKTDIASNQKITWSNYYDPKTKTTETITDRKAGKLIDDELKRLVGMQEATINQLNSQLSAIATKIEPRDGEYAGDGNCYIQTVNIGLGDCTAITSPEGKLILADMGSSSMKDVLINKPDPLRTPIEYVIDDLTRNIFLGTNKFIPLLILSHSDEDHHNQIVNLGPDVRFGRVYYSGNRFEDYGDTRVHIEAYSGVGIAKKVDLKIEKSDKSITKQINGKTPPIRKNSAKPGEFDNEYIDQKTGAIVIYQEKSGFKISVLSSNVNGVYFGRDNNEKWVIKDALIKTFAEESKLKKSSASTPANIGSLVICVEFNNQRAIITGDATAITEYFLTTQDGYQPLFQKLDLYRLPHHGSLTSSALVLVNAMKGLKAAVASTSGKLTVEHGLPKEGILKLYNPEKIDETIQIWAYQGLGEGKKAQYPFKVKTLATGSNGTQIFTFKKA